MLTIRALWWWHLSTSEGTPMSYSERRSCYQHDNLEQTLPIWRDSEETSWGQWEIARELNHLVLRRYGGTQAWQKLRSCLGYWLLSYDGSSSWLLNVLGTSSISSQMFHCNGGYLSQIPLFLGTVEAQKGEFWNRADHKEISQEVHKVRAEGRTWVRSCPLETKESC